MIRIECETCGLRLADTTCSSCGLQVCSNCINKHSCRGGINVK